MNTKLLTPLAIAAKALTSLVASDHGQPSGMNASGAGSFFDGLKTGFIIIGKP